MFSFSNKREKTRGVTLIELIVVMAIFTIVTGVVLVNLNQFGSRTNLELIAQQIAINVRSAQVYGIATRTTAPGTFPSYGVHFATTEPQNFYLFSELSIIPDGYTPTAVPAERVQTYTIPRGYAIIDILVSDGTHPGNLDMVFTRPYPEAGFFVSGVRRNYTSAVLTLRSNKGERKEIVVYNNGQISVRNPMP